MNKSEIQSVFGKFYSIKQDFDIKNLVSGHINQTFLISNHGKKYILQKINIHVFKDLKSIAQNISNVYQHLKKNAYPHSILTPILSKEGNYLVEEKWRMFEFIENTKTYEKVVSADQAFEAAKFLGEFYFHLKNLEVSQIKESIPRFLDFNKRFKDFEKSRRMASPERMEKAEEELQFILEHKYLLEEWNRVLPKFPNRIIHADPKISNFLFDENQPNKILALIDWDTLMVGPVLYDFGDMVRSYTNLKAEDDPKETKSFSKENYLALKEGFIYFLKDELTEIEKSKMALSGKVVIYIQAIRFLTDFFNNDQYFQVKKVDHNLYRTQNQLNLLKKILEEENL